GYVKTCKCMSTRPKEFLDFDQKAVKKLQEKYSSAVTRCSSPNSKVYHNYGGRGIRVKCSLNEWREFFLKSYSVDQIMKLDIDRIDNDGHYEIGNLRLVTRSENLKNRRKKYMTS